MNKADIIAQYCTLELERLEVSTYDLDVADYRYIVASGQMRAYNDILRLLGKA
jgi:hypothetical protein